MEKGKEYFDELKTKGGAAMKEHFGDVSEMLQHLFGGAGGKADSTTGGTKA